MGCEVGLLDLGSDCIQALNFYHACLCSYRLINRLLRTSLLISLKMKFFNDTLSHLVALLLFL